MSLGPGVKIGDITAELSAVVDQAKHLNSSEMAELMGMMGKALSSLSEIAAEVIIAPGGGFAASSPGTRGMSRRMSGIELDDQMRAMKSPSFQGRAAAESTI